MSHADASLGSTQIRLRPLWVGNRLSVTLGRRRCRRRQWAISSQARSDGDIILRAQRADLPADRVFKPPGLVGPVPFADLRAMIGKAETALEAYTPDEVNGWAGRDLDLQIGPRRLAVTSETLILSFSLPNFHFHAVTAYDILRSRGVPIGKRDYEGQLRTRSTQREADASKVH